MVRRRRFEVDEHGAENAHDLFSRHHLRRHAEGVTDREAVEGPGGPVELRHSVHASRLRKRAGDCEPSGAATTDKKFGLGWTSHGNVADTSAWIVRDQRVIPILATSQMREADALAVKSLGTDALVAAAGTAVGLEAQAMLGSCYGSRVAVLVGPGLNGSDGRTAAAWLQRSEEHTSELQSLRHLVCRLLPEKKK